MNVNEFNYIFTELLIEEYAAKYPNIIKPIYEVENKYSKHDGSLGRIVDDACKGKYIAICEGDDYWIDAMKLQKQVDFLESHPEYTLIGSNGIIINTDFNESPQYFNNHRSIRDVPFTELVNTWAFPTASLLFRREILNRYPSWSEEIHFGDDVIVMTCAIHGKVATLGELTCIYRKGAGITNEMDKLNEYMADQHKLFYTHILEDTGDIYQDVLLARIKRDERNRLFWNTRSRSKLYATIRFPKKSLKLCIKSIFKSLMTYNKRRYA